MEQTLYPEKPILCVDDHEFWLVSLEALLSKHCDINNVVTCSDSHKALTLLAESEYSLVLLDHEMPGISGEELLPQMVNLYPDTPVIVLTGHDDIELAVRCMELGAANYFVKSNDQEHLANCIQSSLLSREISKTVSTLEANGLREELRSNIQFISPAMQSVYSSIGHAAENREPLTLVGEKGVGKRMLAESLLKLWPEGNFVLWDAAREDTPDCIDPAWVQGVQEKANGGVVYVENLETSNQEFQREFLLCLQSQVDIAGKIIISLQEDPGQLSQAGKLRSDLANLLKMQLIEVPPLRDRKEDLPFLTNHFLAQAAEEAGKKPPATPVELGLLLKSYHFPGNVGELKKMIFDAIKLHGSRKLSMGSFKKAIELSSKNMKPKLTFTETLPTIEQAIDLLIHEAEKRAQGNQTIMANMLGISRPALNKRLQKIKKSR